MGQPVALIARIAIASPLRTLFDYTLGACCADPPNLRPGMRVKVPFGRRQVVGLIVALHNGSEVPKEKLRPIDCILDTEPVIDPTMLALVVWGARYYQYPEGDALLQALPSLLRRGEPLPELRKTVWQLTQQGLDVSPQAFSRAPNQRALIEELRNNGAVENGVLSSQFSRPLMRLLTERNLIEKKLIDETLPNTKTILKETPRALEVQQQAIMHRIVFAGFHCWLINGVTGSGKTEIYLQLIERGLRAGRQALVLIPEISLTPQTQKRFRERFAVPLVVLHSGLSDKQRAKAWARARSGHATIVIGTRSAIFTPLPNLGLIVVDEEHDVSYKQQDGFRYSARDLAVMRAKRENVPIVLGSATPSLESLYNCEIQRYTQLHLTARAGAAKTAEWRVVDMRAQSLNSGIAETTLDAIRTTLERSQQVLVFLNRRGFAPALLCHACGWVAECRDCDARLTLHHDRYRLVCHHCDAQSPPPEVCPNCQSQQLVATGAGTERSELVLQQHFPTTQVLRVDRDSTQKSGYMRSVFDTVQSGQPCILVGTQMLAKGHHFEQVTLVVILDADSGLLSPDFRAVERMGQLLTQVAGRSGRGTLAGLALVQTHQPDHPVLQLLLQEGYAAFAHQVLKHRKVQQLPPYQQIAVVRAEASHAAAAERFLQHARHEAQKLAPPSSRIDFLGPMPALMERRAGRYRYLLRIDANHRSQLQDLLNRLIPSLERYKKPRYLRWSVDVDPHDF